MKLVEDWRWVTTRSWSFWTNVLAAIFGGLEVLIQFAPPEWAATIGPGRFAGIAALTTLVSNALRLVKQNRPEE